MHKSSWLYASRTFLGDDRSHHFLRPLPQKVIVEPSSPLRFQDMVVSRYWAATLSGLLTIQVPSTTALLQKRYHPDWQGQLDSPLKERGAIEYSRMNLYLLYSVSDELSIFSMVTQPVKGHRAIEPTLKIGR